MEINTEEFFRQLEADGEDPIRVRLAKGIYDAQSRPLVKMWLEAKDRARITNIERDQSKVARSLTRATWWLVVVTLLSGMIGGVIGSLVTFYLTRR